MLLTPLVVLKNLNAFPSDAGDVDPAIILEQIELQVARIKEEAFVRKEILEKVEKWLTACDEECWLEEYNRVKWFYMFHYVN